jgi:hypothetical protein
MNKTINFSASVTVKGSYPKSILEYNKSTMMVCGEYKAIFVDVDTLVQLKIVNNINTDVEI